MATRTVITPTILDLVPPFTRTLKAEHKSPRTIGTYLEAVRGLAAFLAERGMPTEVANLRREHVENYIGHLLDVWTPATANNRYRSLVRFFRWSVEDGEIPHSPMERMMPPRPGETQSRVLSLDEIRALLKACAGTTFDDLRDRAMLLLFVDTGARLAEIRDLRAEDVELDRGLVFVMGKGRKPRAVPIGVRVVKELDKYMRRARAQHPAADTEWLWLGRRGRMGSSGIQQMLRRRAAEADVTGIHPHAFRHTFAHTYLAAGGAETNLMAITGWTDRTMLQRYARSTQAERAQAEHRTLSPADQL